jgi:hypothetical protein
LRKLVLSTLALAVLGGGVIETAQAEPRNPKKSKTKTNKLTYGEKISRKIGNHIQGTHYCQMKMNRPRTEVRLLFTKQSIQRRRYVLHVWIDRHDDYCDALRKYRRRYSYAGLPPHYHQWLCIHSHEGAWNANTGNGYYGGLQMDYSFMSTYGGNLLRSKGTANNWSPLEQMWVAENAWGTRGFYPWPNTARMCGLI